MSCAIICTVSI